MQAREVKALIEETGKDFVGSYLDAGNPMWVVEDPLVTLETLAQSATYKPPWIHGSLPSSITAARSRLWRCIKRR